MKAELHIKSGLDSTSTFDLARLGSYTIGRRSQNDVHLPDKSISRQHCRIDYDGEFYWIVDLDSHNGTYVNGRRVSRCMLYDGDLIEIGTVQVSFSQPPEPEEEEY